MTAIRWAQANERAVGLNGAYSDVLNRALRDVLSSSGYDPDASTFPGIMPVFNVLNYGAKGDGVTDDSAAFTAWAAAINAAGGGVAVIPPLSYKILPTKAAHASPVTATALCAFANLKGLDLRMAGATINDVNVYAAPAGVGEESVLFSWTNCKNIHLGAQRITSPSYTPYTTQRGLIANLVLQGCKNIWGTVDITGGQNGLYINREYTDSVSYRSSTIRVDVVANGTQYPLLARFSGDNLLTNINATGCGRSIYLIGIDNFMARVDSTNQTGSSIVGAYNGYGCTNGKLWYRDTQSTAGVSTSPAVILQFGDTVAAQFRNLEFDIDFINPQLNGGSPSYHTFVISKVDSGNGGAPDITSRGHTLDGCKLIIRSVQTAGVDHVRVQGYFVPAGDTVRNFQISGTYRSTGASHIQLGNLLAANQSAQSRFEAINTDGDLACATGLTVVGATNASPIVLTLASDNDIYDKMQITVSGVLGNTAANGTFWAKRTGIGAKQIALYSDAGLTTPVAGNGAYVSGGAGFLVGGAGTKTTYRDCVAANFTESTADNGIAFYVSSSIASGNRQGYINKTFGADPGQINSAPQALTIPAMTTAQRDALGSAGPRLIYNTTLNKLQGYEGAGWANLV